MKTYWHKPTGVPVSEPSMLELVRIGAYPKSEFEEAISLSASTTIATTEPNHGRSIVRRPQPSL